MKYILKKGLTKIFDFYMIVYMKKTLTSLSTTALMLYVSAANVLAATSTPDPNSAVVKVDEATLRFKIPSLSDLLTWGIRAFFAAAGIAALFFMLRGAFNWVISGGAKDKTEAAQKEITAAVIGIIMIVVVLAVIATLEQVIFQQTLCFGLTCPLTLPPILKPA